MASLLLASFVRFTVINWEQKSEKKDLKKMVKENRSQALCTGMIGKMPEGI
jgi:hypothetical protein